MEDFQYGGFDLQLSKVNSDFAHAHYHHTITLTYIDLVVWKLLASPHLTCPINHTTYLYSFYPMHCFLYCQNNEQHLQDTTNQNRAFTYLLSISEKNLLIFLYSQ